MNTQTFSSMRYEEVLKLHFTTLAVSRPRKMINVCLIISKILRYFLAIIRDNRAQFRQFTI